MPQKRPLLKFVHKRLGVVVFSYNFCFLILPDIRNNLYSICTLRDLFLSTLETSTIS